MNGIHLVAAERIRQIQKEGYVSEHDDEHTEEQLANAATCYIDAAALVAHGFNDYKHVPYGWPWDKESWKPSDDPVRNLVKAGALITAEIDRILRKSKVMTERLDIKNAIHDCAQEIISMESKCIEWGAEASRSVELAEEAIQNLINLVLASTRCPDCGYYPGERPHKNSQTKKHSNHYAHDPDADKE